MLFLKKLSNFILEHLYRSFPINTTVYRYAATDNVPNEFKSKAISLVLGGGIIAAILGPELSKISYNYITEYEYLSVYLIAASMRC